MPAQRKIKLCLVSSTSEVGGADLSLLTLVRGLDAKLYDKTVVLPWPGPYSTAFQEAGATVCYIPLQKLKNTLNPFWHLSYLLRFPLTTLRYYRFFRAERPDLVHLNTSVLLQAGLAASMTRRRIVWHVRELALRPRWAARLIARWVCRSAHRVICISQAVAAEYNRCDHVSVIYNGIDTAAFKPHPYEKNRRLLAIGRLVPFKGMENAIALARRLLKDFPDLTLTLVGGPALGHESYAEELKKIGWDALPAQALFWKGEQSQIESCLADADIFIHLPRDPEPLGRTAIEAGAAGLPSVVFDRGGLREVVQHEKTGFVVPAGNLDAAVDAVKQLLMKPAMAEAMGKQAREWVRRKFSVKDYVDQITEVYQQALNE